MSSYESDYKLSIMIWKAIIFIVIMIVTSIIYSSLRPKDPRERDDEIIAAAESLCKFNEQLDISSKRFDECISKKQKLDTESLIECKKYGNSISELPYSSVDGTLSSTTNDNIDTAIQVSKRNLNNGKQYISSCMKNGSNYDSSNIISKMENVNDKSVAQ